MREVCFRPMCMEDSEWYCAQCISYLCTKHKDICLKKGHIVMTKQEAKDKYEKRKIIMYEAQGEIKMVMDTGQVVGFYWQYGKGFNCMYRFKPTIKYCETKEMVYDYFEALELDQQTLVIESQEELPQ